RRSKKNKTRASALPISEAAWINPNEVFPSDRIPQSSPSRYVCLTGRTGNATAIEGNLCVQARARQRLDLALVEAGVMRYPSYSISCSHSGPFGGSPASGKAAASPNLGVQPKDHAAYLSSNLPSHVAREALLHRMKPPGGSRCHARVGEV